MHILVTGAAGMIGRKLAVRLVKDGQLNGQTIDRLTLIDVVAPDGSPLSYGRPEFRVPAFIAWGDRVAATVR